jgi:hypothetical protein
MPHIDSLLRKTFGFSGDPCVVKSFLEETSDSFIECTISAAHQA